MDHGYLDRDLERRVARIEEHAVAWDVIAPPEPDVSTRPHEFAVGRYNLCRRCGWSRTHVIHSPKKEPGKMSTRRESLERRLARIEEELARLDERAPEPKGEHPVIRFDAQFSSGTYAYAAIKAKGLWNTTGPQSPKAYTWDELMDWLEPKLVGELYVYEEV